VVGKIDGLLAASTLVGSASAEAALEHLLELPALVLDTRARGGARRTCARLQRLEERGTPDSEPSPPNSPATPYRPEHHRDASPLTARIHCCLVMGSISRAARCLEAQPILDPSAEVCHTLQTLHPPVPTSEVPPAAVTEQILAKMLKSLRHGSAAGPSCWINEHIKAATSTSEDA
jgi:hypothetical protein